MQKLNKILFLVLLTFFSHAIVVAQLAAGSAVYVLNEGTFGRKGTIGVVDSDTGNYQHLDSVAAYANALYLSPTHLYVVNGYLAGDVLRYDLQTFTKQIISPNVGARSVAMYGNQLLVCGTEHPYFRVYDVNTLNEIYHLDSTKVRSPREEVVVVNNKAYLSGYLGDTVVAVVDLPTQSFVKNIETAENPYQLEVIDNKVYVGCFTYNPDFTTNTTIQEVETSNDVITQTTFISKADGFTSDSARIYLKKSNGKLLTYTPASQQIDTLANFQGFYYAFQYDKTANLLFVSETDYVSTGSVGYLSIASGMASSMINTDVSPRAFAYRASGTSEIDGAEGKAYSLYPNPATEKFYVKVQAPSTLTMYNLAGKQLQTIMLSELTAVDISAYPSGIYWARLYQNGQTWVEKIVVE